MPEDLDKMKRSRRATALGLIVAIATGVLTIDFKTFVIASEWPKLLCVIAIAAGGYGSEMKKLK
jgi:hypothetical protein